MARAQRATSAAPRSGRLRKRFLVGLACLPLVAATSADTNPGRGREARRIHLADVDAALRDRLPADAQNPDRFAAFVQSLEAATVAREREGEYEHLVYYLLQSRRFTDEPPIEPALSAYEMFRALSAEDRERLLAKGGADLPHRPDLPRPVLRRAADLVKALAGDRADSRLTHFRRLLATDAAAATPALNRTLDAYIRAMRFLYRKEFAARDVKDPQQLEAFLASLYQGRGHSTDTQVEANFAVHTALSVIRAYGEQHVDRVLVVGPGLDFAPRTDLIDVFEPQSYQPFAVADALLALQLADPQALRVHSVDINARVLEYLGGLPHLGPTRLQVLSGVTERPDRPFTPEYRAYFEALGRNIGQEAPLALPPDWPRHLGKALHVRPDIAGRITAGRLNIVTERYDPSPEYDLVVVTNVFSYFDPAEQVLALSNIDAMLREGGYLIHNQPQTSLIDAAGRIGLALADARTVLLAPHEQAPLFDRIVIHRKAVHPAEGRRTQVSTH